MIVTTNLKSKKIIIKEQLLTILFHHACPDRILIREGFGPKLSGNKRKKKIIAVRAIKVVAA